MTHRITTIFVLVCMFAALPVMSSELVLSAPPRENSDVAQQTYGPLASFLSKALGQKVVYQQPKNWAEYGHAMRDGKYDFVFDGPHFVSWRIVHLKHQPIVRLPGTLQFVVATSAANNRLNELKDLRAASLCAMASPNLATDAVLARFGPIATPQIVVTEGGNAGVMKSFKAGNCEAMLLRTTYLKKIPADERNNIKVIFTTSEYANQALTSGPNVTPEQVAMLAKALSSEAGISAYSHLIKRFAGEDATSMQPARTSEYEGDNKLLEGVVWGW